MSSNHDFISVRWLFTSVMTFILIKMSSFNRGCWEKEKPDHISVPQVLITDPVSADVAHSCSLLKSSLIAASDKDVDFQESSRCFLLKVKYLQGTWGEPRLTARSDSTSSDNPASLPPISLISLWTDDEGEGSIILGSAACSCTSQFASGAFWQFQTRTKQRNRWIVFLVRIQCLLLKLRVVKV